MKKVDKPWGYYEDIFRESGVVFKKIVIKPGESLSYQYHHYRDEVWYLSEGVIEVKLGMLPMSEDNRADMARWHPSRNYSVQTIKAKSHAHEPVVFVRRGIPHSIKNIGDEDAVVFEMQTAFSIEGNCREDDIVRFEDQYGRTSGEN